MEPTDIRLDWLFTLPGVITAVATSFAALFTGLAWRSSRYGLRPVVEVAAEGNVDEPQIVKLIITVRNRRHFALRLYEVELVQPRKGVTLFSHHPNSAGGVQRREHRIFMVTRRVEPGSFGNASIFVVLDDDVKEYIGPLRLAIKTSSGSGTVRHYKNTIRRDVELRAP